MTGGADRERGEDVAFDGQGNILVTGSVSQTVDFDPGPATDIHVSTGTDMFVARYDPSGKLLWASASDQSTSDEYSHDIAVDPSGNAHVVGQFFGTVDFDPGAGTALAEAADGNKFYLLRYTAAGDLLTDRVAPEAPAVLAITGDTGEPDGVTTDRTLTLSGTAEAHSTVHLMRDGQGMDTVVADEDGNWTWTDPATLALGHHAYAATAEDTAGNESEESDPFAVFIVDRKAQPTNNPDLVQAAASGGNIDGKNGNDSLFGEAGRDTLKGGNGDDLVAGGSGEDALWGGNGNDRLAGGNGNDTLYGEAGSDRLDGGNGSDRLEGGAGGDRLDGGTGADTLHGGAGTDTLAGGPGADRFYGDADGDWIDLGPDVGRDTVYGSVAHLADDTIHGFQAGLSGDVIAIAGLSAKHGRLLDSVAVTDGALSSPPLAAGRSCSTAFPAPTRRTP